MVAGGGLDGGLGDGDVVVSVVVGSVGVVWDVVAGLYWVRGGAGWGGEGCGWRLGWVLGEGSCWTGHCCGVVVGRVGWGEGWDIYNADWRV